MKLTLLILIPLLGACTSSYEHVVIANKLDRTRAWATWGGTGAIQDGADGSAVQSYDTTQSFGNAATVAGTFGGAALAASVSKAVVSGKTATVQSNNAAATNAAALAKPAPVATVVPAGSAAVFPPNPILVKP